MVERILHRILDRSVIGRLGLQVLTAIEEKRIARQSLWLREVTVALGSF